MMGGMDYRQLFEVLPRPAWVSDRTTRKILAVNEAAISFYGWSRDELLAMTLDDLRPPAELQAFHAAFHAPKASPSFGRSARHWKKDGTVI